MLSRSGIQFRLLPVCKGGGFILSGDDTMTRRKDIFLLILCWVIYTLAQLGRYSYSSNTSLIIDKFGIDHAPAAVPSTAFFFAYGIGQIVVALVCGKYNTRIMVSLALVVSGACNAAVFFCTQFAPITYLWLVNGFAQANLWPVLLLVLRRKLSPSMLTIAGIVMSTASTGGRFAAIGVCALFAIDPSMFTYSFLLAALLSLSVAVIWFIFVGDSRTKEVGQVAIEEKKQEKKPTSSGRFVFILLVFAEFSCVSYAVSGGLQQWVPSILKEVFHMEDWAAILLSVFLPLFTVSVAFISPLLYNIFKNYVVVSLISFILGGIVVAVMTAVMKVNWLPLMITFVFEAICMGIVSNSTTVQVPLTLEGKWSAGFLAGILNGSCYLGSALSSYVLGKTADTVGWTGAFTILFGLILISAVLALIYLIYERRHKKMQLAEVSQEN
ncbi:MAG: MFS transporter [Clostridia bacterium]|nr:MFS transporter [Clostridia bacterium]